MSTARINRRVSFSAGVFISGMMLLAQVSFASDALPIKVEARIESQSLQRAWGQSRVDEIQAALELAWSQRLGALYQHWDFHQSGRRSYAHVRLVISEPESRKILIGMHSRIGQNRSGAMETRWEKTWLEPADFDLGRRPSASRAEQALLEKSRALFSEAEQQTLQDWLHTKIPLGLHGRWQKASQTKDYRIVTSLAWDRFETLKSSIFQLACFRDDDHRVDIRTEGTRTPGAYTSSIGHTYDALVVKPITITADRIDDIPTDEVDRYRRFAIFLAQKRDAVDLDFF